MATLNDEAERLARTAGVETLLRLAIEEDLGTGDVTTRIMVPPRAPGRATFIARQDGVLAGFPVARRAAELAGFDLRFELDCDEGATARKDQRLGRVSGRAAEILTIERVVLNLVQRLSGIATMTRRFVEAVRGYDCVILETRKTIPGWRLLDKYAVRAGGGENHRLGLFDQILVKENHFAMAQRGGLAADFPGALDHVLAAAPRNMAVEVEVETLDELGFALERGVPIIMLDDMGLADVKEAVRRRDALASTTRRPGPLLEVSGGVTLDNVRDYAACGVERISVGALTHSVRALDVALKIDATA
jgi:nicotinate-nucleotide pyrophosphorylase (carboxylating)